MSLIQNINRLAAEAYLVQVLFRFAAEEVCQWARHHFHGHGKVEGVEDPHTHPEAPSDKILSDFFVPNRLFPN